MTFPHEMETAEQSSTPSNPATGNQKSYPKTDGFWYRVDDAGLELPVGAMQIDTTNVSNPPTDAELDSAFGTPATVGAGFMAWVDDNNADTALYLVMSNGTSWWVFTGTKAV